ncbi:CCA tRNA nucleotidyltransferase [Paenibacillus terrigena]|uniref:CCA tRNA nucleotidyltransferase n=1 Tax=Paenibacillus terrigena TaxID=369333 RepID=UPI00036120BB|nr:CCA tRNA nucleotidyltransferase [Paenibacillus terrigena]
MWDQIQADASLIAGAKSVLVQLNEAGFEAYLVGGCVRDTILHKPIHDVDITTSALPAEVMSIFDHTIPTGLQHGTITVVIDDNLFEVTTFREESEYEQYRRPTEVAFIQNLDGDLQRRDFTFNALALDVKGKLHDPFQGQSDLMHRIVRCVGEADARFQEDALRMLRAIRFAACYDCKIDEPTWHALQMHRDKLQFIAMERVRTELEKIVEKSLLSLVRGMKLLVRSELLSCTKSSLSELVIDDDIFQSRIELASDTVSRESWDGSADAITRWALLFTRCEVSPGTAGSLMQRLKFANHTAANIVQLLQMVERVESAQQLGVQGLVRPIWTRAIVDYGKVTAGRMLDLLKADQLFVLRRFKDSEQEGTLIHELNVHGAAWLAALEISQLADLAVRGQDIVKHLKKSPGPWLGNLLKQMLYRVATGEIPNTRSAILDEVNRVIHEYE